VKITIKHNRNVQLCSYGLIASSYDLYDRHDANLVDAVNLIHEAFSTAFSIKQYFAQARSEQISVNPYWPKGSGVVTASLFVDSSTNHIDLSRYLQHEQQAASNMVWQEHDYQQWISQLPEIISIIDSLNLNEVDAALRTILQERSSLFQTYIDETVSILDAFLDDGIKVDELIYIPTVLLAPELTDFVHAGSLLYVLAAEPRVNSMIHELLHLALHDTIAKISEAKLTALLKQADLEKLQVLGYSWDSSEESNRRIVEESIVRCITVMLESKNDQVRQEKFQLLRREGFIMPLDLSLFPYKQLTLKQAREFIAVI
jgi:hypothetical protein